MKGEKMATLKAPFALDRSLNTTEVTPRNIADVLAEGFSHITGRTASEVEYDNTESELTADNVQDALDEINGKIPTVPSVDIQTAVDEFETYNGGLLSALKVSLTPNQDLHGYDNPWVGGASKNKLPLPTAETKNGITLTHNADGSVTLTGTSTATTYFDFFAGDFDTTAYAGYLFRADSTYSSWGTSTITFRISTASRVTLQSFFGNNDYSIDNNGSGLYFAIRIDGNYTIPSGGVTIYPMLRKSTETADFAPYSNICPISGHTQVDVDVSDGQTTQEQITVNLGGTYYSGTLDVVSGVLTVDKVGKDITTLANFRYSSPYGAFIGDFSDSKIGSMDFSSSAYGVGYIITNASDCLAAPDGKIYRQSNNTQFFIKDARFTDVTSFVSALSGQTLCYELATPQTIQLSPTMVKALVGENHLSAPLEGQEITESKYKQMFTFDDVIAYIQSLS